MKNAWSTVPALRFGAAAVGVAILTCIGGASVASALDEPYGGDDVDVSVQITELDEPGVLAMTVAADTTALAENGSTATERRFTGTLPTVTVTDTRGADDPGSVSEGDAVTPGEGFADAEMLAMAFDSATIAPEGSWSANAGLTLKTPATVAPGSYAATLTLSLFE
jgi:hypothetical protein